MFLILSRKLSEGHSLSLSELKLNQETTEKIMKTDSLLQAVDNKLFQTLSHERTKTTADLVETYAQIFIDKII